MHDLIIIGAGGVGRETALIIEQINEQKKQWNLLGFIDDSDGIQGTNVNGYPVLGKLSTLFMWDKPIKVVCAIANYPIKKRIVEQLTMQNNYISFATIIHPWAMVNPHLQIGEGCIVYPNVILTTNITIGKHVILSPKVGIGHDTVIEDYCNLLWNVNISGNVLIEEGAYIGSGATVLQNLRVGRGAIIGAQAMALKDVESNTTVVGVPAQEISRVMR